MEKIGVAVLAYLAGFLTAYLVGYALLAMEKHAEDARHTDVE